MNYKTLITGFPRIGKDRELKKALENYWAGNISNTQLLDISSQIKKNNWILQKEKGINLISCNDFSLYDNMLDTAVMLNAIPKRFRHIENKIDRYFAMARGTKHAKAMEMTKWFNTNYHYIVPELDDTIEFKLDAKKIITEYTEARILGITPKINVIGPLTFLELSKTKDNTSNYEYYEDIISVYSQLIQSVSELSPVVYIQFDEPVFVKNPSRNQLMLLNKTYNTLSNISDRVRIIVTTYFEHSIEATSVLADTSVWGIGLDFVHGPKNIKNLEIIQDKHLVAGIVDGRNVWSADYNNAMELLDVISKKVKKNNIIISTSCSLLHVPYSIENEPYSDVKTLLSFAYEKLDEVTTIAKLFNSVELNDTEKKFVEQSNKIAQEKNSLRYKESLSIIDKMKQLKSHEREGNFAQRKKIQKQKIELPFLPTTTIGSFPQTKEIRSVRRKYKKQAISKKEYELSVKKYINDCINFQESIGLDVLVHGEPERNDMVEYFGEQLKGFHFTANGWVQSYGSRCVKPPIIYSDIIREHPMTVKWITYAQSLTEKPVKGMLTGPVTIINWSFVRQDKPKSVIAKQIAIALREEITDLQNGGIKIIQVDEAAFKEGYPLRTENIKEYETWAISTFKLAVSSAHKQTQIHTHMCYSDFEDILDALKAMDADVISIENARSNNELLGHFTKTNYENDIGPGVYDIHSPRVPTENEFYNQIQSMMKFFSPGQLWVNPDCGLKTRNWEQVKPALENMVRSVQSIRNENTVNV